jgi:hypothetical protein
MEKLEQSTSGLIQRNDLSQAIQNVKAANGLQMNSTETEALVASIFTSADFSSQGKVSRMAIREALEKNQGQVATSFVDVQMQPQEAAVTSKIM